jgi:signal transduction histidine kinase
MISTKGGDGPGREPRPQGHEAVWQNKADPAVAAPDGVRFHGERQDLEEMFRNLVDNACKWAQARVSVEVTPERVESVSCSRRRVRCA